MLHLNTIENFSRIVDALKQNDMPPMVDFVVGYALDPRIQQAWLESGNLLGNMTYSRAKPKKSTVEEFIQSAKAGDEALASLWGKFPPKQKYFRFPGLTLDEDQQKLAQIRGYLKQKGYVEAPATIDSWDDSFSQSYCGALARRDQACASLIKARDIFFVSPTEGWAVTSKAQCLYHTIDGGRSWLSEPRIFDQDVTLARLSGTDASHLWAVGGAIFHRVMD